MKRKDKGTVCVTGAAGFIGSNLTKRLLAQGYRVTGLDNLSQGQRSNMAEFIGNARFRFVKADVRSPSAVRGASRGSGTIVHLAAFKIPRYGNAYDTLIINTEGTRCVLEAARKEGSKVVFASTSDVYGMSQDLPFQEEGNVVLGHSKVKRWAYAASKLFDEHLCFAYEEKYGIPVAVLRFFGSYGPNQNLTWWGGPQSVFIARALRDEPLEIHGDGAQTRSFTYIDDTVDGIFRAMTRKKACGEVLNIGNTQEITIRALANLIWQLVRGRESRPKLNFVPYSRFSSNYQDVRRRVPDLKKAQRMLGYTPKVPLTEGLRRTIAWQRTLSES
jgi:UDP-glucose 4-epimerase